MSLHGHHSIDMAFRQSAGYPMEPSAHQHMYQTNPYVVHPTAEYSNPPSLSQSTEHYAMPHAIGMMAHMADHAAMHSAPMRKSKNKDVKGESMMSDSHKLFDRKEKNRQAAQRSRKRKQDHMDDLEATVKRQSLEIESLRAELAAANNRLMRLRAGGTDSSSQQTHGHSNTQSGSNTAKNNTSDTS
eukprot:m.176716 g.176716  ORF g.176716 m.176716 type:complete len:186 (-) comp14223_c0_seq1:243-800(-)